MAATTRQHGKKGVILLSTTGTSQPAATVSLSAWTLNKSTDKVDVTAFGDTNKVYVQGLPDISGTLSGWFDSSNDALFDAAESSTGAFIYLYPSSDIVTGYHYGPIFLDASIECPSSGAVSVSGSFVANGAWTRSS